MADQWQPIDTAPPNVRVRLKGRDVPPIEAVAVTTLLFGLIRANIGKRLGYTHWKPVEGDGQ